MFMVFLNQGFILGAGHEAPEAVYPALLGLHQLSQVGDGAAQQDSGHFLH